jgi:hypothetical protein
MIVIGVVAGLLFIYFFNSGDAALKYQWQQTFKSESDQPYGTAIIKDMLKHEANGNFIYNTSKPLKTVLEKPGTYHDYSYVLIGQSIYLDNADIDALLAFISDGNDVFIASMEAPAQLVDEIHYDCENSISYDGRPAMTVSMNFFNDALKKDHGYEYTYRHGREDASYFWYFIDPYHFCDSSKLVVPIGYQDGEEVNFIKVPHGAGNLYLHSTPLTFTNYFMLKQDKVDYASTVFSHLKHRRNVIWDEYSKVPFVGNQNSSLDSPLYYILQQPSLKYAWWLLLLTIVLYVFVAAKRAQRPIPVLEVKSNTSLEFVRMISSLHYVNGNHMDMAKKKMKYFLYFIRSRYGIHETNFTSETVTKLAEKSKVDRQYIADIINQYHGIEGMQYNILPDTLTAFFDAVERFYKHCK